MKVDGSGFDLISTSLFTLCSKVTALFSTRHEGLFILVSLVRVCPKMEETQGTGTPRQQPAWRSAASSNWRVKDDSPRLESPANKPRFGGGRVNDTSSEDAAGTRLYVGNLLYTAQKADIETLFAERGFTVTNVNISTDPFTGRNPSYCFVDLGSADEAARAITELNGVDVLGRSLKVSPGVARRGPGSGSGQGSAPSQSREGREGREGQDGGREVRVKNYDRGYARESRDERSMYCLT